MKRQTEQVELVQQIVRLTVDERDKLATAAERKGYKSVNALIRAKLGFRAIRGSGRPSIETPCVKCGKPCKSALAARKHCVGKRKAA